MQFNLQLFQRLQFANSTESHSVSSLIATPKLFALESKLDDISFVTILLVVTRQKPHYLPFFPSLCLMIVSSLNESFFAQPFVI